MFFIPLNYKFILFYFILFSVFIGNSQKSTIYVPFKVKNKFGISDENGKIVIKPQFDYISVENSFNFFTCYNYLENEKYESYLIINNKIVIKKQQYFGYYYHNDVIFAVKESNNGSDIGKYTFKPEEVYLYTIDGKILLKEGFLRASSVNEIMDKNDILSKVLILLIHQDKTYSIILYDKILKNVAEKIIINAKDIDYTYDTHKNQLKIKYVDKNNIGKKINIKIENSEFVKTFENDFIVNKQHIAINDNIDDEEASFAIPFENYNNINKHNNDENKDNKFLMKHIFSKHKTQIYRPLEIYQELKEINSNSIKKIFDNKKVGLYDVQNDKIIIEPKYDDIFKIGNMKSYLLLKDNKFYFDKNFLHKGMNITINCGYDYFPIITFDKYGNNDFYLISLFDNEGNFLYYANNRGFVYFIDN
jgi:hypothetical protein